MRIYASAYLAYAVKLSGEWDGDAVEIAIRDAEERFPTVDLRHFDAGHFGSSRAVYITTKCFSVSSGEFQTVETEDVTDAHFMEYLWGQALTAVAVRLDDTCSNPGWMLVCDVDY